VREREREEEKKRESKRGREEAAGQSGASERPKLYRFDQSYETSASAPVSAERGDVLPPSSQTEGSFFIAAQVSMLLAPAVTKKTVPSPTRVLIFPSPPQAPLGHLFSVSIYEKAQGRPREGWDLGQGLYITVTGPVPGPSLS